MSQRNINLAGERFGRLVALYVSPDHKKRTWVCKCDCGNTTTATACILRYDYKKSCGCLRSGLSEENRPTFDAGSQRSIPRDIQVRSRYADYKNNAKSRGVPFGLTKSDVEEIIYQPCHYCGEKPNPTSGIDRMNNDVGYVFDNCLPCCRTCNFKKKSFSYYDFIAWVGRISDNLGFEEYGREMADQIRENTLQASVDQSNRDVREWDGNSSPAPQFENSNHPHRRGKHF